MTNVYFAEAIKLGHGNGDRLGNHDSMTPNSSIYSVTGCWLRVRSVHLTKVIASSLTRRWEMKWPDAESLRPVDSSKVSERENHDRTRPVSANRTLASVRSTLTGRVQSWFSLSRTLLESTGRRLSASGHFTSQRPVTSRRLHHDQMNWPDSTPASGQYLTLHSLPTFERTWMKFAPMDLRAF